MCSWLRRSDFRFRARVALAVAVLAAPVAAGFASGQEAQTVFMGQQLIFSFGAVPVNGTETILEVVGPANVDGLITAVTFGWSTSPCPSAVTVKFFRPHPPAGPFVPVSPPPAPYDLVAERGPFDVTTPVVNSTYTPLAIQTVSLSPAVSVQAGDVVALTNRTSCGAPVYVHGQGASSFFDTPTGAFRTSGDVTTTVPASALRGDRRVFVTAAGTGSALALLGNRFAISLDALDPRTGTSTVGTPIRLTGEEGAGYFSLPEFTGDPTFPEVVVKMVDARGVPALGGNFWFFHAPLTDVRYVLTVRDQLTGTLRTYSNAWAGTAQLCGGFDGNAFPGSTP